MGPFGPLFTFLCQLTRNKSCQWLDSNRGSLVSEATALPTVLITTPYERLFTVFQYNSSLNVHLKSAYCWHFFSFNICNKIHFDFFTKVHSDEVLPKYAFPIIRSKYFGNLILVHCSVLFNRRSFRRIQSSQIQLESCTKYSLMAAYNRNLNINAVIGSCFMM